MSEQHDSNKQQATSGGIYTSRGMSLQIPAGGLSISIGDDGEIHTDITFNVCIDLYVYWLEIALRHLKNANRAHLDLLGAWRANDGKRKELALEDEFASSLQAIVAAAIAVDAFYAMVRRYVSVPEEIRDAWRKNRTSRPRQITEVFRSAFVVSPNGTKQMGELLGELFKWRDWSVHPSADFQKPVFYEELGVGTEWRFVAFRAENAKGAVRIAISILAQLLTRPRETLLGFDEHCKGALKSINPLVDEMEREYGELYPREKSGGETESDGD